MTKNEVNYPMLLQGKSLKSVEGIVNEILMECTKASEEGYSSCTYNLKEDDVNKAATIKLALVKQGLSVSSINSQITIKWI